MVVSSKLRGGVTYFDTGQRGNVTDKR